MVHLQRSEYEMGTSPSLPNVSEDTSGASGPLQGLNKRDALGWPLEGPWHLWEHVQGTKGSHGRSCPVYKAAFVGHELQP